MATDPRIRYDIQARASGAADVEKLAQEFEKLDGAFPDDLAGKVRNASQQLEQLGQQQQAVETFTRIKGETEQARKALDDAQAAAQRFGRELAQSEAPTRAQAGQLEKLKDNVRQAKDELVRQTEALDRARAGLTQFGISGEQVGQRSVALRQQVGAVRAELEQLARTGASGTGFQQLVRETDAARQRMEEAARAADALAAELQAVQRPTDGEAAKLRELRAAADTARADFERLQTTTVEQGLALRQAGVNTELLTARTREAAAAQQNTAAAAKRGAAAYTEQGVAAQRAAAQQTAAATTVRQGLDGIAGQLRSIQALAATVLGGQLLSGSIGDIARTADAYANLEARIKLVTGEGAALTDAFNGVFDVALRTNSAVEGTGTLFARIAQAGLDMGLSTSQAAAQALQLTETIQQAIQVSGGSAQAADAAVTQLIQGLQSGVLRGEEFNSVMEQAPRLARALADGLGVTTGELRKLAQEGKLTAQTVLQALQSQSGALKREFEQLPATVSRALTNLSTEWTRFIGQLNESSGATAVVADGINKIADNLDVVARLAAVAGTALTASLAVRGVAALRALSVEAAAASRSATLLTASLNNIPKIISVTVAAAGFEVGFQIGEMLRENSILARQLGVGLVAFTQNIINDLQLLKEAAAAVFTSDTIDAAFDRYRERGRQLDETFSQMWKDAEQVPTSLAAAADQAGQATDRLATQGQAAGNRLAGAAGSAAGAVGQIGRQANTAEGAIQAIATAAGQSLPTIGTTAEQQSAAMVDLLTKSDALALVFSQNLPQALSKLSGAELAKFRASLVDSLSATVKEADRLSQQMTVLGANQEAAFVKGQRAAKLLQEVLVETGTRAAESLGVDVVASSDKVSAAFRESQDQLALLVQSLPALKAAGVDAGTVVSEALGGMIQAARNQAEIDAIIARLQALGEQGQITGEQVSAGLEKALNKAVEVGKTEKAIQGAIDRAKEFGAQGKISGDQVADATDKAKQKLDELKPGINSTAEAYRTLGLKSREEMQRTADVYGRAYKTIAADAKATIAQKIEAFQKWSAAAIEANGGVETAEVKLQREILNTQAKAAGLGEVFVDAMQRTKVATDAASESLNRLATSASSAYDEATKARKAADLSVLGNVDSSGFTLGPDGQRFTVSRQIDVPDGYTFDNAAFQRAQRNAALTGGPAPDPANFYVAPSPGLGEITPEMAAEQGLIRNGDAGFSPLGANRQRAEAARRAAEAQRIAQQNAAARAAAAANAGGGTTTNVQIVRLQIGNTSTDVRVGSASDAAALTAFMDQLAAAARSAGINLTGP